LEVSVVCKKRPDTDEITNEIKGYAAADRSMPAASQSKASVPPWRR
jgi:hypothetical protein